VPSRDPNQTFGTSACTAYRPHTRHTTTRPASSDSSSSTPTASAQSWSHLTEGCDRSGGGGGPSREGQSHCQ
jgi:hypothetical protein